VAHQEDVVVVHALPGALTEPYTLETVTGEEDPCDAGASIYSFIGKTITAQRDLPEKDALRVWSLMR
jgi:hypothetical protein